MKNKKSKYFLFLFVIITLLSPFTFTVSNVHSTENKVRFVPPVPPDRGAPNGRSRGAASRTGSCQINHEPLTALVPHTQETLLQDKQENESIDFWESVWGLTTSAYPTFWFYQPYNLTGNQIEFVLQDEQANIIHQSMFSVAKTQSGIVKYALPSTIPALEIDKMYHWYFLVYCDDEPVFVEGGIKRINLQPDWKQRLQQATAREKIIIYATQGIWYDALTNLAELKQINPEDQRLQQDWQVLLTEVGLETIATEPIINCCTPQE